MVPRPRDLPDFAEPPVAEVALSVQFEPLATLHAAHLGLLWATEFRDRFPSTQDHAPLAAAIEQFGSPRPPQQVEVKFEMAPAVPRCWFLDREGTELVQVQQDRFVRNWRKVRGGETYPRYEHIKQAFESDLARFAGFVAREKLGEVHPNQCEVTYVNHIATDGVWQSHGDLDRVVRAAANVGTAFLPRPERVQMSASYVIPGAAGSPIGRLHVKVAPAFRALDQKPIFVLILSARGRPADMTPQGVGAFLDLCREWIVRGFAEITTEEMHKAWRRLDA